MHRRTLASLPETSKGVTNPTNGVNSPASVGKIRPSGIKDASGLDGSRLSAQVSNISALGTAPPNSGSTLEMLSTSTERPSTKVQPLSAISPDTTKSSKFMSGPLNVFTKYKSIHRSLDLTDRPYTTPDPILLHPHRSSFPHIAAAIGGAHSPSKGTKSPEYWKTGPPAVLPTPLSRQPAPLAWETMNLSDPNTLATVERELRLRERQVELKYKDIITRERALDRSCHRREIDVSAREKAVNEASQQLEEMDRTFSAQKTELKAREVELERQLQALRTDEDRNDRFSQKNETLSADLERRQAMMEERDRALVARESAVTDRELALARRDASVSALQEQLQDFEKEAGMKRAWLEQFHSQAARLEIDNKEQESTLYTLAQQLKEYETAVAQRERICAELIADTNAKSDQALGLLQKAERQNEEVEAQQKKLEKWEAEFRERDRAREQEWDQKRHEHHEAVNLFEQRCTLERAELKALRETLEQQKQELDQQQQHLAQKVEELAIREVVVHNRETMVDERDGILTKAETAVRAREKAVSEREITATTREEKVHRLAKEQACLELILEESSARLALTKQALTVEWMDLIVRPLWLRTNELLRDTATRESKISFLENGIAAREASNTALGEILAKRETEITAIEKSTEQRKRWRQGRLIANNADDRELARRKTEAQDRARVLELKKKELEEIEYRLVNREEELAESSRELFRKQEQLMQGIERGKAEEERIAQKQTKLQIRTEDLDARERKVRARENEIDKIAKKLGLEITAYT